MPIVAYLLILSKIWFILIQWSQFDSSLKKINVLKNLVNRKSLKNP